MDEDDFDALVRSSSRSLLRSAWLFTGNWAEAEDLVQTTLAKAWQRWAVVSAADSPEAYVQAMLANAFVSSRRRVRWSRELVVAEPPERPDSDDVHVELRHAVAAALDELAPRQRAVVVLRYFCDLSVDDTARALDCSTGNVKSLASKALGRLERSVELRELREDAS